MSTLATVSNLNNLHFEFCCQALLKLKLFGHAVGLPIPPPWGNRQGVNKLRPITLSALLACPLLMLSACGQHPAAPVRKIVVQQTWELNSGDFVSGHLIAGGLGDITVNTGRAKLRAPYSGQVEPAAEGAQCIYFSTPEIPAYLFRYCGVRNPRLGPIDSGQVMAAGNPIHFATLRRQPDGTWAIVEPSNQLLEKSLRPARTLFF